jgi:methylenetetrahydrofolate dehydrogenase (NADP+)/methenyltetrahydrofolate cyclohydrolase
MKTGKELKGSATAKAIRRSVEADAAQIAENGVVPQLAIVRAGCNADDTAYIDSIDKRCGLVGVAVRLIALETDCTTKDVADALQALCEDAGIHGVLVMRPLPRGIDERAAALALCAQKDVDGMTPASLAAVFTGSGEGYPPCTAQAVIRLLKAEEIEIQGKEIVVIGRSLVVGRPLAMMFLAENATVTICHTRTRALAEICRRADILVACAGVRHMVTAEFVKHGAVLVDVGIHADEAGNLSGDIDPSACERASAYTPVPGGVGVLTGWILIEHVVDAAKKAGGN